MSQSIVILGGSFDPVHQGHLKLALYIQEHFNIEQVLLLPCGTPVLKKPCQAGANHRRRMLELAIADFKGLSIDEHELLTTGPSFTIDTLKYFRQQYGPQTSISFIIGEDAFAVFFRWHQWQDILSYANIINTRRLSLSEPYSQGLIDFITEHRCQNREELKQSPNGRIYTLDFEDYPFSSTAIRDRIAKHQRPQGLAPQVFQYIQKYALYRFTNEQ